MREEIANASELIKGNIDDLTIIDREKNSRLIDLFSRMTKLMDCVVLNYDTFSEQDITDFNYVRALAKEITMPEKESIIDANMYVLEQCIKSYEQLFRDRKFLLEDTGKSM